MIGLLWYIECCCCAQYRPSYSIKEKGSREFKEKKLPHSELEQNYLSRLYSHPTQKHSQSNQAGRCLVRLGRASVKICISSVVLSPPLCCRSPFGILTLSSSDKD
ncbi:hypothetical protein SK128_001278 [Halocaridina rubra]|uniref:Uncharacterized protein n=1 Tax=Halocaridina rubra TaxID=373956 RepID=A0AAN8XBE1_HALRR